MDPDTQALGHTPPASRVKLKRHDDAEFAATLHAFVIEAAQLLQDRHCENVLVFDVRGICQVTDYILIATGTSDRQIKSLSSEIKVLARERQIARMGDDAAADSSWVVVDLVDLVVHLFDDVTRAHYDIEMMWNDAPQVDISRSPPPGS